MSEFVQLGRNKPRPRKQMELLLVLVGLALALLLTGSWSYVLSLRVSRLEQWAVAFSKQSAPCPPSETKPAPIPPEDDRLSVPSSEYLEQSADLRETNLRDLMASLDGSGNMPFADGESESESDEGEEANDEGEEANDEGEEANDEGEGANEVSESEDGPKGVRANINFTPQSCGQYSEFDKETKAVKTPTVRVPPDYPHMTVNALRLLCNERSVAWTNKDRKSELIEKLSRNDEDLK